MNVVSNKRPLQCLGSIIRRTLTKSCSLRTPRGYEGEGKTTMHVMNKDDEYGLMIDGYSEVGFKLNNNMTVLGPMIIFPKSVLAWNIEDISEVTEDSLSLLKILEPKIDILVLGTGDKVANHNLFAEFIKFSRKYRISFEILPTESACPTFNFLNAEGRNVVGALIPPKTITLNDDDIYTSKLRYQDILVGD